MNISGYSPILSRLNAYSPSKSAGIDTSTFRGTMADTTTSSPAVTVSISAQARAALSALSASPVKTQDSAPSATAQAASVVASFDTTYNNIDHSQAEYNAHYAEGARAVSASQGLAEGQYDFTKMSSKEAFIVANDMIVNHGATPDQISGFTGMIQSDGNAANSFSDAKIDFISAMQNQRDFETAHGNSTSARFEQMSLDYIQNFHSTHERRLERSI